jgi:hypothetical protein
MIGCVAEPVSWLRLERYALGELAGPAADDVAAHLGRCPACQACLDAIERDATPLPPLPPLPPRRRWAWWPRLAWAGGVAAAAAAIALFVVIRPRVDAERVAGPRIRVKGTGDVVVSLIRERGGVITPAPSGFAPGDRFKVRVTCAPGGAAHADVVVFQGGEAAFPLPPARLRCGNDVVVPGAFTITGVAPATVCLVVDPARAPDRAAIARRGPRGDGVGCVAPRLPPEPAPP